MAGIIAVFALLTCQWFLNQVANNYLQKPVKVANNYLQKPVKVANNSL
jgi:hypothetical protein